MRERRQIKGPWRSLLAMWWLAWWLRGCGVASVAPGEIPGAPGALAPLSPKAPLQVLAQGSVGRLAGWRERDLGMGLVLYESLVTGTGRTLAGFPRSRIGNVAIQENHPVRASLLPDDPLLRGQWAFQQPGFQPFGLWDRRIDASTVTVAVLDSGIDAGHPELAGRVLQGRNFIGGGTDTRDFDGHGTHVAGIIGATGNNGFGIAGLAWNVRLLPVKVLQGGNGSDATALQGLRWAVSQGARVINMSFNSSDTRPGPLYASAVAYARAHGVVVVAAAGNDGAAVTQPANSPGLLAVAATTPQGRLARWSNRGPGVNLGAPGEGILSALPRALQASGFGTDSGTSMAAPFISGIAALLLAEHPAWTPEQVEQAIKGTARPLGGEGGVWVPDLTRLP